VAVCALASASAADPPAPDASAAGSPPSVLRRLSEIVARGVFPADRPDDPTSFTTVIPVEERAGESFSTEELLARAPGVQVRRFGGPGEPAEVSIRGSSASQVVVRLDGVRLNTAQAGRVDLSTIPVALLDRIEISRGGGSVQAGSDAVGGVVDLVTLRPGGEPRTRAVAAAGAFDTFEASIARAGTAAGFEYVAGWDGFRTDGDFEFERLPRRTGLGVFLPVPAEAERINNHVDRHSLLLGAGRSIGERLHVSLRDHLLYASRGMPGLDSGSVPDAGQRDDAHERRFRHLAHLQLDAAEIAGLPLGARAEVAHLLERLRFRDPDPVLRLGGPIDVDELNTSWTLRLHLDGEAALAGARHRLATSVEHRRDALAAEDFGDPERSSFAWLVQDDAGFLDGRLRLVPALRWERTQGFEAEWLPRIGVVVEPVAGLRFKANLERAYRVPNFDELYFPDEGFLRGNPDLAAEESTDADAGLELAFERLGPIRDLRLEAALFDRNIDESIVFVLVGNNLVEPHNTGPATARGVELAAGLRLLEWLELSANHTRLRAEKDDTGTPLPGRAERETSVRAALGPPSGAARLIGEMHAVSEIPVTDTGNTIVPERTTWDLALWVDLARLAPLRARWGTRSLLLGFEVANLTDEVVRDVQYFPQPGRTWMLRLESAW
jgi:outer membrane cobalamin receptor